LTENVLDKHVYFKRNAVICLYEIYLSSRDELVSNVDGMMEKMLVSENDLSTA
jgi:coatomer subunit beta